jgi:hypothetical protein
VEGILITVLEMDEHRINKVRVSRGALEEEDLEGNDPIQELYVEVPSEQRGFTMDRIEPIDESNNPRPETTWPEVAPKSVGRSKKEV